MAQEINNPHDAFFKTRFSRPQTAAEFMRHYLPPEISRLLDLDRLELVKDSFADAQLQEHFSDLLYRVGLVGQGMAYIHLLLEHKSAPDDWVALQTLRYAMFDWLAEQRGQARKLPVILPVVLYHGTAKWKVPREFSALFEVTDERAALRAFVPEFRYHLCDLSQYTDTELNQGTELPPALLALRYVFSRDAKRQFTKVVQQTAAWQDARERLEFLETLAIYYATGSKLSHREVVKTVDDVFKQQFSHIKIPLFERWRQDGRVEGRREGRQEGLVEGRVEGRHEALGQVAMLQLHAKFDQLSKKAEERIRTLSAQQLEQLSVDLLGFNKPRDVTDWLRKHTGKRTK